MVSETDTGKHAGHESEESPSTLPSLRCPACGAAPRRRDARFCATCGRSLDSNDYLPSDAIRSSYHHQRNGSLIKPSNVPLRGSEKMTNVARHHNTLHRSDRVHRRAKVSPEFFTMNKNGASTTGLAFVTYALVPYLGILFCPGAILMGGIGLLRARRAPHLGGRRASFLSVIVGLLIFCAQLVLWWILYKVPEWAQQP